MTSLFSRRSKTPTAISTSSPSTSHTTRVSGPTALTSSRQPHPQNQPQQMPSSGGSTPLYERFARTGAGVIADGNANAAASRTSLNLAGGGANAGAASRNSYYLKERNRTSLADGGVGGGFVNVNVNGSGGGKRAGSPGKNGVGGNGSGGGPPPPPRKLTKMPSREQMQLQTQTQPVGKRVEKALPVPILAKDSDGGRGKQRAGSPDKDKAAPRPSPSAANKLRSQSSRHGLSLKSGSSDNKPLPPPLQLQPDVKGKGNGKERAHDPPTTDESDFEAPARTRRGPAESFSAYASPASQIPIQQQRQHQHRQEQQYVSAAPAPASAKSGVDVNIAANASGAKTVLSRTTASNGRALLSTERERMSAKVGSQQDMVVGEGGDGSATQEKKSKIHTTNAFSDTMSGAIALAMPTTPTAAPSDPNLSMSSTTSTSISSPNSSTMTVLWSSSPSPVGQADSSFLTADTSFGSVAGTGSTGHGMTSPAMTTASLSSAGVGRRKKYSPLAAFGLSASTSSGSSTTVSGNGDVSIGAARPRSVALALSANTSVLSEAAEFNRDGDTNGLDLLPDSQFTSKSKLPIRTENKSKYPPVLGMDTDDHGDRRDDVLQKATGNELATKVAVRALPATPPSVAAVPRAVPSSNLSSSPPLNPNQQHHLQQQRQRQHQLHNFSPQLQRGPPLSPSPTQPLPPSPPSATPPATKRASSLFTLSTNQHNHRERHQEVRQPTMEEEKMGQPQLMQQSMRALPPPNASHMPTPPMSDDEDGSAGSGTDMGVGGNRESTYYDASTGSRSGLAFAFTSSGAAANASASPVTPSFPGAFGARASVDETGVISAAPVKDEKRPRTRSGSGLLISPASSTDDAAHGQQSQAQAEVQTQHPPRSSSPSSTQLLTKLRGARDRVRSFGSSSTVAPISVPTSTSTSTTSGIPDVSLNPSGSGSESPSYLSNFSSRLSQAQPFNKIASILPRTTTPTPTTPTTPATFTSITSSTTTATSTSASTSLGSDVQTPLPIPVSGSVLDLGTGEWVEGREADPFAKDEPVTVRSSVEALRESWMVGSSNGSGGNGLEREREIPRPLPSPKDKGKEREIDTGKGKGKEREKLKDSSANATVNGSTKTSPPRERRQAEVRGESLTMPSNTNGHSGVRPRVVMDALARIQLQQGSGGKGKGIGLGIVASATGTLTVNTNVHGGALDDIIFKLDRTPLDKGFAVEGDAGGRRKTVATEGVPAEDVEEESQPQVGEEEVEAESEEPKEPTFYPLAAHLTSAPLLAALLPFLSFRDFLALTATNDAMRRRVEHERETREEVMEWVLGDSVGYVRWKMGGGKGSGVKERGGWGKEGVVLTFRDLNAYMRGVSVPTHQFAASAQHWLETRSANGAQSDSGHSNGGANKISRSASASQAQVSKSLLASSCRAYTRVVLRLRAQAEASVMESANAKGNGVYMGAITPPQSTGSFAYGAGKAGSYSRAESPSAGASVSGHGHYQSASASVSGHGHGHQRSPSRPPTASSRALHRTGSPTDRSSGAAGGRFRSPLFRLGHAPLLRVFVPSPGGEWLSDESVLECEKELRRAGVEGLLRAGDVVWDCAVGDEGNAGRMVWDGYYLIDLDYTYSLAGEVPSYLHTLAFPPSYFHRVVRTQANPIVHVDVAPWAEEIAAHLQLLQDRIRTETPQGALHTVVRWVHRSSFRIRAPPASAHLSMSRHGHAQEHSAAALRARSTHSLHSAASATSLSGAYASKEAGGGGGGVIAQLRIPGTALTVDPGWWGTVVIEAEGTNEGLADLQARCGHGSFPQRATGVGQREVLNTKKAKKEEEGKSTRTVWKLLRERSRPGEIWIRAVTSKERLA